MCRGGRCLAGREGLLSSSPAVGCVSDAGYSSEEAWSSLSRSFIYPSICLPAPSENFVPSCSSGRPHGGLFLGQPTRPTLLLYTQHRPRVPGGHPHMSPGGPAPATLPYEPYAKSFPAILGLHRVSGPGREHTDCLLGSQPRPALVSQGTKWGVGRDTKPPHPAPWNSQVT